MSQMINTYLEACEVAAPKRKTKIFDIRIHNGARVGVVKWFARWRRYNFFPDPDTSFDALCMRDLASFCERLMDERKP